MFGAASSGSSLFGAPASSGGAAASSGGSIFGGGAAGGTAAASGSSLFGSAPASSAGGSIFGSAPSSSGSSLFGSSAAGASSGGSLFGAPAASSGAGGSIFGATSSGSSGATSAGGGLFGSAPAASSGGSLFGGAPAAGSGSAASSSSIFGAGSSGGSTASSAGLFGAAEAAPAAGGLFGAASAASASSAPASLFGASSGGATSDASAAPATSLFGAPAAGSSLFGTSSGGGALASNASVGGGSAKEQCRRSMRFWRGWLERGGCESSATDADAVFTDDVLRERLAAPLQHFDAPAPNEASRPSALPERAAALAKEAATTLGLRQAVADDLVQLYADDKLSSFSALHYGGSVFDLLDVSPDVAISDLARLLHSEKCQAFQVLACILRNAHDDTSKLAFQCRELAQHLLSNGLGVHLWSVFQEVSSCPNFTSLSPEPEEVLSCVNQGIDLQLCVLECLALAGHDPELHKMSPEMPCRMADLFLRQRFLASLSKAAHAHKWVLAEVDVCERAQCMGDLCLAVLLQSFGLESLAPTDLATFTSGQLDRHSLLCSPDHVKHIHKLMSREFVDLCELGSRPAGVPPANLHCARMASLALLGWVALLASAPAEYRELHDLRLDRIMCSAAFRSPHLAEDAAKLMLARGFAMSDAVNREHSVVRWIYRNFAAAVAARLRLDKALPGLQLAVSNLARAAHVGDASACHQMWTQSYAKRNGCFFILHAWLQSFPEGLGSLLELVGSLVGSRRQCSSTPASLESALYTVELLKSPMSCVLLPYQLLEHAVAFVTDGNIPSQGHAQLAMQESVYIEEVILHAHGLLLPEWHVSRCALLKVGDRGILLEADGNKRSQPAMVRWRAGHGLSIWRLAMVAWDAMLEGLGLAQTTPRRQLSAESRGLQLLPAVLRCVCPLLAANPQAYAALSEYLPTDERSQGNGLLLRLLVSFHVCAELGAQGQSWSRDLLPSILRALAACASADGRARADVTSNASTTSGKQQMKLHVLLLDLLSGSAQHRFRLPTFERFMTILNAALDHEKEGAGMYPITQAALECVDSLLSACRHEDLVFAFVSDGHQDSFQVLRGLLDFVFGTCFSRCSFWRYRSVSVRRQLSLSCIRIAKALIPVMECFNWPPSVDLEHVQSAENAGSQAGIQAAMRKLRDLQLCVLRCWSEASFVPTLLNLIICDVVFGPASSPGSQFAGFRSAALEDSADMANGVPERGCIAEDLPHPICGADLLANALECFHGLLGLVIRPAGFAPQYAPLLHHLLEVSSAREPLVVSSVALGNASASATAGGLRAAVPQRAGLVQSLYAQIRMADKKVAEWATRDLVSVCALWSRADARLPKAGKGAPPRRALLFALLSVPITPSPLAATTTSDFTFSNAPEEFKRPASLTSFLGRHLLDVIGSAKHSLSYRCASAELARAALAMRPGLYQGDGPDALAEVVAACGRVLLEIIAMAPAAPVASTERSRRQRVDNASSTQASHLEQESPTLRLLGRFLLAVLGLLDDLAVIDQNAVLCGAFSRPVKSDSTSTSSGTQATLWHALSKLVTSVLLPWLCQGRKPKVKCDEDEVVVPDDRESRTSSESPLLATTVVLRLVDRGCTTSAAVLAASKEAHEAMLAVVGELLGPALDIWLPASADVAENGDELSEGTDGFDMMRRPFGESSTQSSSQVSRSALDDFKHYHESAARFHGLLSKCGLREEWFDPLGAVPNLTDGDTSGLTSPAASGLPVAVGAGGGAAEAILAAEGVAPGIAAAMPAAGNNGQEQRQGPEVAGRACVPPVFRWWGDLVELACGAAVERALAPPAGGRAALRETLRPQKLGTFGDISEAHSGCACLDAYVVGAPLRPTHTESLKLFAAANMHTSSSGFVELEALAQECSKFSRAKAVMASRTLAAEALDDLSRSVARLVKDESSATTTKQLLTRLLLGLVGRLFGVLHSHMGLVVDHSGYFARIIMLITHLLASPPHGSALLGPTQIVAAFSSVSNIAALKEADAVKALLQRETPMGLALVRQLVSVLQVCVQRLRTDSILPPPASSLLVGAAFASGGVMGYADAVVASLSLLMLLVPGLRQTSAVRAVPDTGRRPNSFEASSLLAELLDVLSQLLACVDAADLIVGYRTCKASNEDARAARDAEMPTCRLQQTSNDGTTEKMTKPQPGWPARAPVVSSAIAGRADGGEQLTLVRSPEDALARCAAETRTRALDHALKSGIVSLVLGLAERAVTALRDRATRTAGVPQPQASLNGQAAAGNMLQHALLPRLLSCSCIVFSPKLDQHRITLGLMSIGGRPGLTAPLWDRAVEAAWATRLDAVVSCLFSVSQTAAGAVVLAEQRCFALLAYCPLLHASIMPQNASASSSSSANAAATQFPAAYAWPASNGVSTRGASGGGAAATPWRRPLHVSWCSVLQLVASILASAPQLSDDATVFLEAYAPRLRYVFRNGIQSGHMAVLEEANAICRVLALMKNRSGLVESLLAEAAMHSLSFVVNTCLTERSSPSEVFLPVSGLEQLSGQSPGSKGTDDASLSQGSPASVPSVFHQRVEFLALDLCRNLLATLLRAASSPTWLGHAAAAADTAWSLTPASAPSGWPAAPSVLGLGPQATGTGAAEGGPRRLWASVMDAALDGARHVVDLLESLPGGRQSRGLLLVAQREGLPAPVTEGGALVPLSLALAVLEPDSAFPGSGAGAGSVSSPSFLSLTLTPPLAPRSPSRGMLQSLSSFGELDGTGGAGAKRQSTGSGPQYYRYMALRPASYFGGQHAVGIVPDYVSVADLRGLCGCILEMTCTLLCHFCQASRSSIMASPSGGEPERGAPAVLHGLLSFLHELRSSAASGTLAIDKGTLDYLTELDNGLRSWQQLGSVSAVDRELEQQQLQQQRQAFNAELDGEPWMI